MEEFDQTNKKGHGHSLQKTANQQDWPRWHPANQII